MGIRVAINGFGRIGRAVMRASLSYRDIEIVAINDLAPAPMLHYLLSKDSVHGPFGAQLQLLENGLEVAGRPVAVLNETKPGEVDFSPYDTDVVLECTGRFLTTPEVAHHLAKGVKKVIISAPATDETPTYVLGVNASFYQGEAIISNASCTTNCLAPLAKIID
ncbi:MAG: type I glyceraldehyde-3-phosphate dehydrogenase, partial [Campylobacterales bacterium]